VSAATDQLARLLVMVPWLRARPGIAPQRVADEFGITMEQLEADLNLLIVCGVPGGQHGELFDIEFWAEDDDEIGDRIRLGPRITVHDAQRLERPLRLAPDEAIGLLVGLQLLDALPGPVDHERIAALAARLESAAGDAVAELAGSLVVGGLDAIDPAVTAAVDQALAQGRRLDLAYLVPSRDEVTHRQVDPRRLVVMDGHAYLVAWCRSAEAERRFRLDRVVEATVSAAAADPVPEPPAESPRYRPGADDLEVEMLLAPAGRWIAEYAVVDELVEEPDGVARVRLRTPSLEWIARLVLRGGGAATVVQPPALSEAVRSMARRALEQQDHRAP
jgi:proteasome accessory factor C